MSNSRPCSRTNSRAAGVTLVEVAVALLILGIATTSLLSVFWQGDEAFWRQSGRAHVESMTAIALERIVEEMRQASPDTFTPAAPVDELDLSYRIPTGFVAGEIVWSGVKGISFSEDVADIQDNLQDDDGDGLTDEGEILMWDADTGESEVLVANVKNDGLAMTLDGTRLTITLTVQQSMSGEVIEVTATTDVTLRNSGGTP